MKKKVGLYVLAAVALVGFVALWFIGVERLTDRALADSSTAVPMALPPPAVAQKVTFLELGSVGCRPCEAMKPVMQAVRNKYGKQVEVRFHDVREDRSIARKWGIRLIPTQIFLDPAGKEIFRHEGFFALAEVEEILLQMGVR